MCAVVLTVRSAVQWRLVTVTVTVIVGMSILVRCLHLHTALQHVLRTGIAYMYAMHVRNTGTRVKTWLNSTKQFLSGPLSNR